MASQRQLLVHFALIIWYLCIAQNGVFSQSFAHAHKYGMIDELSDYNFGLVVQSSTHTIYRSSMLGEKGLQRIKSVLQKRGLAFPKTIVYMSYRGYDSNNSAVMQEFHLQHSMNYRFYHRFGLAQQRTYLDGVNPFLPKKNIHKGDSLSTKLAPHFASQQHMQHDGNIDDFKRILRIILKEENQPVLFHCKGGRHRSGMVAMAIRYLQGGDWIHGKKRRFWLWKLNPAAYEYSRYNRYFFRKENITFIEQVTQMPFFTALKKRYHHLLLE